MLKPLSPRQYGFLREVAEEGVSGSRDSLIHLNQLTLWSVLYRGYISVSNGRVSLTKDGRQAWDTYRNASAPLREQGTELTDRVRLALEGRLKRIVRGRR